jgi:hypothetical protein
MYKDKSNVKFIHIQAHTTNTDIHSIGNYNADKLANMAISLKSCPRNTSNNIYILVYHLLKKKKLKN